MRIRVVQINFLEESMVLDKVIKILADYKGMSADKITAESTFFGFRLGFARHS